MIALALCVLAFVVCFWAGRRSLGQGLVALLCFGYFYGILRANLLTAFSHFIFDAGMLGLFAATWLTKRHAGDGKRSGMLRWWSVLLILWPVVLLALPFQPLLVSLVGFRGNTFFIPVLLIGSRLKEKDLITLSAGLAVLNLVALGFAGAEYVMGVPRFFPYSPVTQIIYDSQDAGGGFYRIPAIFSSAHAFGGTMVSTIPFLVGLWTRTSKRLLRWLALIAIPAALLGILMSSTRQNFVLAAAMIIFVIATTKMKPKQRFAFLAVAGVLGVVAFTNSRFQRFKSLGDTEAVEGRIAGSVNLKFLEILTEYPMGNGLGGGGTSMPYFLQGQVRNPVGMENEYARILCEQGIIGLGIWACFIAWFVFRAPFAFRKGPWANSRRLLWCFALIEWGTAFIGTGLLTSIPETLMLMLAVGWTTTPEPQTAPVSNRLRQPVAPRTRQYTPALP